MKSSSRTSDDDLLRRLSRGDEDAFMTIYRQHRGPVYRFALRVSGSAATAEDVAQETFLALLRPGQGFDSRKGALRSYLYGIARNQVGKRLGREVPVADRGERATPARGEDVAAVRQALAALPLPFREVVVLCELEGLSYEEAALVCDVPVGTIRSRLHRARAQLLEALGGGSPAARADNPTPSERRP
jgi:RNA polymerase sigma-70 factor (ECF subfamily)